ncbi:MAG: sugar transferase [bacterium]|nr:sugar transferase [bacterium]MCP5068317.1 sugar transferase [bacterium]
MLREHSRELDLLLQGMDLLIAAVVFVVLVSPSGPGADAGLRTLLPFGLVASLVWPVTLRALALYSSQRRETLVAVLRGLALAGLIAVLVESAAAFLTRAPVPRWFPLVCASFQLVGITCVRVGAHATVRSLRRAGRNSRKLLIAGSGPRAAYVEEVIGRNPAWGLEVIGFIDERESDHVAAVPAERIFALAQMTDLLRDNVIDEVVVACPRSKLDLFLPVVDRATAAGVPITLLSDIFGDLLPVPRVKRFGALPALSFAPVHHNVAALALKRALDVAGAAVGLVLVAPILIVAALGIKLSSPGPILFRQIRCSLNGRRFVMPKLRTMGVGSDLRKDDLGELNEMDGPVFKIRNDPRVTPVGRLLRRYSLDELPQLWSVLKGDMSLVGPRPPVPGEVASYKTFERRRLSMRPGLTCLWQVNGRNEIGFEDWVRLDLEYIDTWSLVSDFRILVRTLPAVLSGHGAS